MTELNRPRRNTWQRKAVRAALAEADGFVSAQQLHQQLRDEGSTIGLATVYRALSGLAQEGEADALQSPDGESLYRSCTTLEHHHHLICRVCGETKELESTIVESWARSVAAEYGYSSVDHRIDLFGLCSACQKRGANSADR